jgi:thiamine-phosphate pyrophosphorylase
MIICLVTDRRRLGAAIGVGPDGDLDLLSRQITAAAAAGIDLVQIREPDLDARRLADFTRSIVGHLRHSNTKVLLNDRLDVALAAGADGVHLKETSFAPELARALISDSTNAAADKPKNFLVACSVHTAFTATARSSADFIVAGTVLPTVSKSRADYLQWKGLENVVRAAQATPVLAIGGLDLDAIPALVATGAAGLAAIGAFIPTTGDAGFEEFVKKRVIDMRFAFDSAQLEP